MSDNAFDTSNTSTCLASPHQRFRTATHVPEPCPDDPAIIIGLAAHFSRLGQRGDPIPKPVLERLRALAAEGVPSAGFMYWEIVKRGKAPYVALTPSNRRSRVALTHSNAPVSEGER